MSRLISSEHSGPASACLRVHQGVGACGRQVKCGGMRAAALDNAFSGQHSNALVSQACKAAKEQKGRVVARLTTHLQPTLLTTYSCK